MQTIQFIVKDKQDLKQNIDYITVNDYKKYETAMIQEWKHMRDKNVMFLNLLLNH